MRPKIDVFCYLTLKPPRASTLLETGMIKCSHFVWPWTEIALGPFACFVYFLTNLTEMLDWQHGRLNWSGRLTKEKQVSNSKNQPRLSQPNICSFSLPAASQGKQVSIWKVNTRSKLDGGNLKPPWNALEVGIKLPVSQLWVGTIGVKSAAQACRL